MASVRVLERSVSELSPRLACARVRWAVHDAAGAELCSFAAAYTLAHMDTGLRITALAHDELPR